VRAGEVQHTVGKLSMRAITLVKTSSQSEFGARSYERPKSRESKPGQFRDSTLGVPRKRAIWMQVLWRATENTIWGKVVASPESEPWGMNESSESRLAHGESSESKLACGLSQHQKGAEQVLTNLLVGFGCRTDN
jgi:hypothetical protein